MSGKYNKLLPSLNLSSYCVPLSLQRVVLTGNRMASIPFPGAPSECLPAMKYLSLSDNRVSAWSAIDALSCWFPALESLTIAGNPLVTTGKDTMLCAPTLTDGYPQI